MHEFKTAQNQQKMDEEAEAAGTAVGTAAGTADAHIMPRRSLSGALSSSRMTRDVFMTATAIEVQTSWFDRMGAEKRGLKRLSSRRNGAGGGADASDVFLGGSCNPTTWRTDTAIPMMDTANVGYYNPQVENWYPELAAIEGKQKENSTVLLFIIDNTTRALASILESTEYLCRGRVIVLAVMDVEDGAVINGEVIGQSEKKDLNRARAYVCVNANICVLLPRNCVRSDFSSTCPRNSTNSIPSPPLKAVTFFPFFLCVFFWGWEVLKSGTDALLMYRGRRSGTFGRVRRGMVFLATVRWKMRALQSVTCLTIVAAEHKGGLYQL